MSGGESHGQSLSNLTWEWGSLGKRLWRPSTCQMDAERMSGGDLPSSELLGASPLQGMVPEQKHMEVEAGS